MGVKIQVISSSLDSEDGSTKRFRAQTPDRFVVTPVLRSICRRKGQAEVPAVSERSEPWSVCALAPPFRRRISEGNLVTRSRPSEAENKAEASLSAPGTSSLLMRQSTRMPAPLIESNPRAGPQPSREPSKYETVPFFHQVRGPGRNFKTIA